MLLSCGPARRFALFGGVFAAIYAQFFHFGALCFSSDAWPFLLLVFGHLSLRLLVICARTLREFGLGHTLCLLDQA